MNRNLNVYKVPVTPLFRVAFDGFEGGISHSRLNGATVFEQFLDTHRVFITMAGTTRETVAETDDAEVVRRPDRPGVVTIVPAGRRRRVFLRDIDLLVLDISVTDDLIRSLSDDGYSSLSEVPQLVQNESGPWLMRAAHELYRAGREAPTTMLLQSLSFAIVRSALRMPNASGRPSGLDPAALRRVLQLMHDRLGDDLALTDLAREVGLGVSGFSRAFSKSLGCSAYKYFVSARMTRAKELIADGSKPLAEIAGEVGYSDQAHFTAAFTRNVGSPPGKWRADMNRTSSFLPISRKTQLVRPK